MSEDFDDETELSEEENSQLDSLRWESYFDDDLDDVSNVQPIAVTNILQKTDRILAEDEKIMVVNNKLGGTIGMANIRNKKITLDIDGTTQILKDIKMDSMFNFVTLAKAVNYHELAHLTFTDFSPNQIQDFIENKYKKTFQDVKYINTPMTVSCRKWKLKFKIHHYIPNGEFKEALNILEDLRIERLFSTQYPRAKYYFSFSLAVLNSPRGDFWRIRVQSLLSLYALWYGRRKLFSEAPAMIKEVRKILEQKISKDIIKMSEEIVDSFIIEDNTKERLELAYFFAFLFNFLSRSSKEAQNDLFQSSSIESIGNGRYKRPNNLLDLNDEIKEEDGEEGQEKESKTDKKEKELDEEKESKKDEENVNRNKNGEVAEQIHKLIEEIRNSIESNLQSNENFKKEVEQNVDEITGRTSIDETGVPFRFGAEEQFETGRIELLLRKLRGDLSASYQRYESRGKIDVPSFIRAKHNQDLRMFAHKTMNKMSLARLGVSILIDSSASIGTGQFTQEIKAVYCFSKALERLQNKVEVIEFSSNHRILKGFNQTGDWKRSYGDGTDAERPIANAIKDLNHLKSSERIFNQYIIVVSDGHFDNHKNVENEILKAHSFGIKVIWIFVGNMKNFDDEEKSRFDEVICIEKFTDLSQKMQSLVNRMQREVILNIQRRGF